MSRYSEDNKLLFIALLNSNIEQVYQHLRDGHFDSRDHQLLISAIDSCGHEQAICCLLEAGWNANARDAQFKQTALMWAANRGMAKVVSSLIEHGGDVNAKDDSGSTAALSACSNKSQGNVACLRLLINHGIDVNLGSFHSPLMWAISDGTEAMAAILLEAGAEPNRFYGRGNALYAAIENNRTNTISILLQHGADPLATVPDPWEPPEYAGLTLIEFAMRMKRPKLVSILAGKPIPVSSAKLVLLPLMWRQIAKKLQVLNVDPKDVLNPATNEVAIQAFESQLGSPLPATVKKSWMIHDGQPPEAACFRLRNGVMDELAGEADLFRLIPISEMFAELQQAVESYASMVGEAVRFQAESGIAPVAWATSWLPLARNLAGDLLCCDLAPPQGGTVGQIILASSENPVRTRIAIDWCECLENLAVGLVEDDE